MPLSRESLAAKAKRITMVMLDVDGVLTDGGLYYNAAGHEMKRFHAHDGYGIVRGREAGLRFAIISGRNTPIVEARARMLQIEEVVQGTDDKVAAFRALQLRWAVSEAECAYMGDDLFDIPLLKLVGLSAAPRNALPAVKHAVQYVTRLPGGEGAVREFVDLILSLRTSRNRGRKERT
jgi:3-deoxy-D-manno-octulosonate 8-phosphate phosphatase (KDO 8-P phosphatase)